MMTATETVGAPTCVHLDLTRNLREQMTKTISNISGAVVEAGKGMIRERNETEAVLGTRTGKTKSE